MIYPTFITCRDQVSYLRELVSWLELTGNAEEIYLMDNASTYEPLLDYLKASPHTVIRMADNYGHVVGWNTGTIEKYSEGRHFINSDSDVIPTEECPHDLLLVMRDLLDRSPDWSVRKVGISLKIDDLPDHYVHKATVVGHESQFWVNRHPELPAWLSPVDGTFAMYPPWAATSHAIDPAYRTLAPYVARHMPWYEDSANLTEEQQYYRDHVNPAMTHWSGH